MLLAFQGVVKNGLNVTNWLIVKSYMNIENHHSAERKIPAIQ